MQIRVGFEMAYRCPQPTPMLLALNIHYSRASDLVRPDLLVLDPPVPLTAYRDLFGNWCSRIVAPPGRSRCAPMRWSTTAACPTPWRRRQCRRRSSTCPKRPWSTCSAAATARPTSCPRSPGGMFGTGPTGWARVQAICDFVHQHIKFGYRMRAARKPPGGLPGTPGRLPRLRAPGDHASAAASTSRRATAPATSATSACRRPTDRWISPAGSRPAWATAGTPSTRATTCRASAAC